MLGQAHESISTTKSGGMFITGLELGWILLLSQDNETKGTIYLRNELFNKCLSSRLIKRKLESRRQIKTKKNWPLNFSLTKTCVDHNMCS